MSAITSGGFNEPEASLDMAETYRAVAGLSRDGKYYLKALDRIAKADDLMPVSEFGGLGGTPAHVRMLRLKARVYRESGLPGSDPQELEAEADRMEASYRARQQADKSRHEMPGGR